MAIGTLGSIVFEASSERVRTFTDASHTTSARWAAHEVIGRKPVPEFVGPGLRTMSLRVRLVSALGVDPEAEAARLREAVEGGEGLALILGGKPRGDWTILNSNERWRAVRPDGVADIIDLTLSLQEYSG